MTSLPSQTIVPTWTEFGRLMPPTGECAIGAELTRPLWRIPRVATIDAMPTELTWPAVLTQLLAGADLSIAEATWAMERVMEGEATPAQLGAFLVALHGSCTTPLAAHARIEAGSLQIDGMVGAIDGSRIVRGGMHEWIDVAAPEKSIETARKLGRALAESLLDQGARALIDEARASSDPYVHLYSTN